ncbi:MAG TPA: hypothetical protein VMW36_05195 [Patescibacteria group bacterium]|nr:hypothetical protein [Patescibacteria group bacterium]
MRALTKISIFLGILIVDLAFFIPVRQLFPEGYEWIIVTTSHATQISLETIRSLFVIGGFVLALICVLVILYFVYSAVRQSARREY